MTNFKNTRTGETIKATEEAVALENSKRMIAHGGISGAKEAVGLWVPVEPVTVRSIGG